MKRRGWDSWRTDEFWEGLAWGACLVTMFTLFGETIIRWLAN